MLVAIWHHVGGFPLDHTRGQKEHLPRKHGGEDVGVVHSRADAFFIAATITSLDTITQTLICTSRPLLS